MKSVVQGFDRGIGWLRRTLRRWVRKGSFAEKFLKGPSLMIAQIVPAYRRVMGDGVFFRPEELPSCSSFPKEILDATLEIFQPRTVLDLGCGTGVSLDYLLEQNVDVVGVEGSAMAIAHARHPERILQRNLNQVLDLGRRFDVLWSYEVVEHIHPRYLEAVVSTFSNHSDTIIMSAARPGQGGDGHFNEQEPEYWIEHFARKGYACDLAATARLRATGEMWSRNMLVLARRTPAKTGST